MRTWTAEQVRGFLAQVENDPLVGLWHLTTRGLRRGEVLGFRWGDTDLEASMVHIRQARVQAGPDIVTGPAKTARGRRSIPLDPEAARALRLTRESTLGTFREPVSREQTAAVVPLRQPGTGEGMDARLIAVDAAGQPLRPEVYGDAFTRHASAAGLPVIRLHDARHTALSLLPEQGTPVHVVARFAGHDPSVTLRTYAPVSDQAMSTASTALGALYGTR